MQQNRSGDALLKWVALAVPGISAGIGWTATAGWPPLYRILWGVAVGVAIYALIHFLIKGRSGNRS